MSLQGQTVRIIIHKPENWNKGNLFGTIISDRGGKTLLVKLSKQIFGKEITSDIIELQTLTDAETFKPLEQNYTVMVNGSLKSEETEMTESVIFGSVTSD